MTCRRLYKPKYLLNMSYILEYKTKTSNKTFCKQFNEYNLLEEEYEYAKSNGYDDIIIYSVKDEE